MNESEERKSKLTKTHFEVCWRKGKTIVSEEDIADTYIEADVFHQETACTLSLLGQEGSWYLRDNVLKASAGTFDTLEIWKSLPMI